MYVKRLLLSDLFTTIWTAKLINSIMHPHMRPEGSLGPERLVAFFAFVWLPIGSLAEVGSFMDSKVLDGPEGSATDSAGRGTLPTVDPGVNRQFCQRAVTSRVFTFGTKMFILVPNFLLMFLRVDLHVNFMDSFSREVFIALLA
jgi:hypothetical protein